MSISLNNSSASKSSASEPARSNSTSTRSTSSRRLPSVLAASAASTSSPTLSGRVSTLKSEIPPVVKAAMDSGWQKVEELLNSKPPIPQSDLLYPFPRGTFQGGNILWLALHEKQFTLAKKLIQQCDSLDIFDTFPSHAYYAGRGYLALALEAGENECIDLLLAKRPDIEETQESPQESRWENRLYTLAITHRQWGLVKAIFKNCHTETINELIQMDFWTDSDSIDPVKQNSFMTLMEYEQIQLVDSLLSDEEIIIPIDPEFHRYRKIIDPFYLLCFKSQSWWLIEELLERGFKIDLNQKILTKDRGDVLTLWFAIGLNKIDLATSMLEHSLPTATPPLNGTYNKDKLSIFSYIMVCFRKQFPETIRTYNLLMSQEQLERLIPYCTLIAAVLEKVPRLAEEFKIIASTPMIQRAEFNLILLCAVRSGFLRAVEVLVDNGADVNHVASLQKEVSEDDFRLTPLALACQNNFERIASLLVEKGATVDKLLAGQQTPPLHIACRSGHLSMVRWLLVQGAALTLLDQSGGSPLHAACSYNQVEVAAFLMDQGIKADVKNKFLITPLLLACKAGSNECIDLLLQREASLTSKDAKGNLPIHFAAFHGRVDVVKRSTDLGLSLAVTNLGGDTPLHFAAENSQFLALRYLLEKLTPHQIKAVNHQGATALFFALDAFLEAEKNPSAANKELRKAAAKCLALLLQQENDINRKNREGHTLLHRAFFACNLAAVEFILINKPQLNIKDQRGFTPFGLAYYVPEKASGSRKLINFIRGLIALPEIDDYLKKLTPSEFKWHLESIAKLRAPLDNQGNDTLLFALLDKKSFSSSELTDKIKVEKDPYLKTQLTAYLKAKFPDSSAASAPPAKANSHQLILDFLNASPQLDDLISLYTGLVVNKGKIERDKSKPLALNPQATFWKGRLNLSLPRHDNTPTLFITEAQRFLNSQLKIKTFEAFKEQFESQFKSTIDALVELMNRQIIASSSSAPNPIQEKLEQAQKINLSRELGTLKNEVLIEELKSLSVEQQNLTEEGLEPFLANLKAFQAKVQKEKDLLNQIEEEKQRAYLQELRLKKRLLKKPAALSSASHDEIQKEETQKEEIPLLTSEVPPPASDPAPVVSVLKLLNPKAQAFVPRQMVSKTEKIAESHLPILPTLDDFTPSFETRALLFVNLIALRKNSKRALEGGNRGSLHLNLKKLTETLLKLKWFDPPSSLCSISHELTDWPDQFTFEQLEEIYHKLADYEDDMLRLERLLETREDVQFNLDFKFDHLPENTHTSFITRLID